MFKNLNVLWNTDLIDKKQNLMGEVCIVLILFILHKKDENINSKNTFHELLWLESRLTLQI